MIAAIYVRKSTDQNVADEAKPAARQVENARALPPPAAGPLPSRTSTVTRP